MSVKQLADEYSVTGKTVSRDINEIKSYLSENGFRNKNAQIIYSDKERAYYLSIDDFLSSKELQAMLESSQVQPALIIWEVMD